MRRFVGRAADDLEVFLRRERAAVALGGGAVGNVIEQRLRRRADDGDDVGAGPTPQKYVIVATGNIYDDALQAKAAAGAVARMTATMSAPASARRRDP